MTLPRHAEIWLADYLRSIARARRARRAADGVVDILLTIADHYEPFHGQATEEVAHRRVRAWLDRLPMTAGPFVDSDGRHPQHTFFFPIEQYRREMVDQLAALCRMGLGEVEIHLHHDNDTAAGLRQRLIESASLLNREHGLLARDAAGIVRYGFIHGNWALDNSRPDGRWCGVNGELAVLKDTGCYADFTLPAAPSPAQTRTVNEIYYADVAAPGPKAHDRGTRAAVGTGESPGRLLIVQGPLSIGWRGAKWGIVPRLDSAALDGGNPPHVMRFEDWLSCRIGVAGRPEWVFIKVHTHGALERNADAMLGKAMSEFHRDLLARFNDGRRYRLHYVTAREMVNIIHAAEAGRSGNAGSYRNVGLPPPAAAG